ncbi:hypothetical protein [Clostridium ihumii]|uniref:hypothetical protein n=1 Tax=Clostridium ihumii TaxID=1470356 RepID=UPI000554F553|nr:hypothetical protein [Clostridium ihumii]
MKLKSMPMILTLLLFVIGIFEFMMIFMKIEIPLSLVTTSIVSLVILSMCQFVEMCKIRKLVYPFIVIHFLLVMPSIEKIICNNTIFIGITVLSAIVTIIFLYKDFIISNKEKNMQN